MSRTLRNVSYEELDHDAVCASRMLELCADLSPSSHVFCAPTGDCQAATWVAAGTVFYIAIYRPAEQQRRNERAAEVLTFENDTTVKKGRKRTTQQ